MIESNFEEGEEHVYRVAPRINVGISGILFYGYWQYGDIAMVLLSQEEKFGIKRKAFNGLATEKIEGNLASKELESTLSI